MATLCSYYSTYLAAKLAGMASPCAKQLAGYCQSTATHIPKLVYETSQSTLPARRPYNPLTDVDWKKGGKLNGAFSRKMAMFSAKKATQSISKPSHINKDFAIHLLNDIIYKAHKPHHKPHMDAQVALTSFGQRLAVYQSVWLNQQASCSEDKTELMLQAFYWTQYAIACFLTGEPIKDKLRIRIGKQNNNLRATHNRLKQLLSIKSDQHHSEQQ